MGPAARHDRTPELLSKHDCRANSRPQLGVVAFRFSNRRARSVPSTKRRHNRARAAGSEVISAPALPVGERHHRKAPEVVDTGAARGVHDRAREAGLLADWISSGQRGERVLKSPRTVVTSPSRGNGFCRKGAEVLGEPRRKMSFTSYAEM